MKKLALIFFFILFTFLFPSFLSAHMPRNESHLQGQMHIDPDDNPIAGLDAKLNFKLENTTEKFDPQNCDCTVNIFKDDLLIFSQPIFPIEKASSDIAENFSLVYIFPGRGQYFIHFIGEPKTPNDFEAFRLEFDVQVDRGDAIPTSTPTFTPVPPVTEVPIAPEPTSSSKSLTVVNVFFLTSLVLVILYFLIWRKK